MSNKNTPQKEISKVQVSSGNICARCHTPLLQNGSYVGTAAHIYGENPGAARYDETLPMDFVNSFDNLLPLCATCHTMIDKNPDKFPVDDLFKMKKDHQKLVNKLVASATAKFTYAEIEVLVKYIIANSPSSNSSDFTIIKLEDKIKKNALESCQDEMKYGLASLPLIRRYLTVHPDITLAKTVTSAVVAKYLSLKETEETTVDIFNELWDFTSGNHSKISYRTAGLGILMYFFESCEVFEK